MVRRDERVERSKIGHCVVNIGMVSRARERDNERDNEKDR